MISLIALSDTHIEEGDRLPRAVLELASRADIILHAGDFVSVQAYSALKGLGRLVAVRGNCDSPQLKRLLPEREVIDVSGVKIGLVHMASHGSDLLGTEMMAREMECDVLVFGHIHRPLIERSRRLLICPGSTTLPRMSAPSLAEIEIEDGRVQGRIIPLGSPVCNYLRYAETLGKKEAEE